MEENKVLTGNFKKEEAAVDNKTSLTKSAYDHAMSKKINVENFCKRVNLLSQVKTAEGKENENLSNFIESHIATKYVDYATKCDVAQRIINATCYETVGEGDNAITMFKQDSPARYLLYCMSLIDMYTDIDVRFENHILDDFDMLSKDGLIDLVIAFIPESEVNLFSTIIDMKLDDVLENERNITSVFRDMGLAIKNVGNAFVSELIKELGESGISLGDIIKEFTK